MLPENISSIAPIIATIGSMITSWDQLRPPGSGTSGGAESNNSPAGNSGPGRRSGRRTTIVDMSTTFLGVQVDRACGVQRPAAVGRKVPLPLFDGCSAPSVEPLENQ
ncbi:hypothetical protein GCM10009745_38440 [Kribbella yunnanensis]|uniref:Uncharacterized protein n=1 Tax=Kribbella yunnanensis TaxID=190194 RepID=A0ABP4TKI4_9ACTN